MLFRSEARARGIEVVEVPTLRRNPHPADDVRTLWALRDLYQHWRPDVVFTHMSKAGALGRLVGWWSGVPTVHTYHGKGFDVFSGPGRAVTLALERRLARLGAAIIRRLEGSGVAACGKHFPGHGDTSVDSHLDLPLIEHPPDRIRRVECVPFVEAIRQDVAFIMTAHILIPSFDEERPATLSPKVVQALLRDELGYQEIGRAHV